MVTTAALNTVRQRCGFTVEFYEAEIAPMLRSFGEHMQLFPAAKSEESGSFWIEALARGSRALMMR